jgi:thiamine pyrophosphokinase
MRKITVIANGNKPEKINRIQSDEIIIAVDGGAHHCINLGITPEIIIGDFDSISKSERTYFEKMDINFIQFPTDKDETDLEIALDYATKIGVSDIDLYGLLGGRWDMSFANLMLLASEKYSQLNFRVVDENLTVYIIRSGETLNLAEKPGTCVSTLPLNGPVLGIYYEGLKWNLENESLSFGSPRGVSNWLVEPEAKISIQEGILLVFVGDYCR